MIFLILNHTLKVLNFENVFKFDLKFPTIIPRFEVELICQSRINKVNHWYKLQGFVLFDLVIISLTIELNFILTWILTCVPYAGTITPGPALLNSSTSSGTLLKTPISKKLN